MNRHDYDDDRERRERLGTRDYDREREGERFWNRSEDRERERGDYRFLSGREGTGRGEWGEYGQRGQNEPRGEYRRGEYEPRSEYRQRGEYGQREYPRRGEWQRAEERERDFGRGEYSTYGRGASGSEGGYYGTQGYTGGTYGDYGNRGRSSSLSGYQGYGQGEWGARGYGSDAGQWKTGEGLGRSASSYGREEGMRSYGGYSGYTGGMGSSWSSYQGRYTGRGPKNYQRSDERIREDINEQLTRHPDVDATEIDVQVTNCEVTLTGTVDDRHAKRLAEDLAEGVSGVKNVHNQIRVERKEFETSGVGRATTGSTTSTNVPVTSGTGSQTGRNR